MDEYNDMKSVFAMAFSGWDGNTDPTYVDTHFSYIRTPSFLNLSYREIQEDPHFYELMKKSFPYNGPKLLEMPIIRDEDGPHRFKSPINEALNKYYPMQCIRSVTDWTKSEALLIWHLNNGFRLAARCSDPMERYDITLGYFHLSLLYRPKKLAHLPRTGIRELVKFLKVLEQIEGAPPAVFFTPTGREKMGVASPHLAGLEMELVHTTSELETLWARVLGGKPALHNYGEEYWWIATNYKPKHSAEIPDYLKIPEFEKFVQR